ncbi:MAG: hypothetical protein GY805_25065 [Chloroflexi bacterium]|nr:hypothetical protein [Chloroflexota bacterium]
MAEQVTLNIPQPVAQNARAIAARTQRRMEDVLIEWIDKIASELPVDSLSDEEVLTLCDLEMTTDEQTQLSALLTLNREGTLNQKQRRQLDKLMTLYRKGMIRKAQAWQVAVTRGLKPPIN